MPDKRTSSAANRNAPIPSARLSLPLDVKNHIRAREAVGVLLDRQRRYFVARKVYGQHGLESARVLIDGKYYDVNQRQLDAIRAGASPEDLGIDQVGENDD